MARNLLRQQGFPAMATATAASNAFESFFETTLADADPEIFGARLAEHLAAGQSDRGIALCGSGIGISIAVNRNPRVRCALVSEPLSAQLAREHNDANAIALGARLVGLDMAKACVTAFLETPFAGGRHQRRVDKLSRTPQDA
jgi:ribose 5-phosphate isomerase B